MGNLKSNPLFWAVISITVINLCFFLFSKIFIEVVANRVVHKLQKDYSPSPYEPGFNPDKIDVQKLRQKVYYELNNFPENDDTWREEWESLRFTPEQ